MKEQFAIDINEGLSGDQKTLPSKYFYDQQGDELFNQIMNMPEYYLTKSEHEIFKYQSDSLISALDCKKERFFELIELGAGDGTKTKELLQALQVGGYDFDYHPIDISPHVLHVLKNSLAEEIPELRVKTHAGDYFDMLESIKNSPNPKIVLFLGSNIGNLSDKLATEFIYNLGSNLSPGDKLVLGVDLIKPAEIVLPAYDDQGGITEDFNLNLLTRINRELGADFNTDSFRHDPEYSEAEGVARSFLVSTEEQVVSLNGLGKKYKFRKGEKIQTEISRKYNDEIINRILDGTDFTIGAVLKDSRKYFADYILNRG